MARPSSFSATNRRRLLKALADVLVTALRGAALDRHPLAYGKPGFLNGAFVARDS